NRDQLAFAPWDSLEKLDLILHSPNAVSWTVTLPEKLERAIFHTAVTFANSFPTDPDADGVTAIVTFSAGDTVLQSYGQELAADDFEWFQLEVPLTHYAGQTITIRLTSLPNENIQHDWLIFQHPTIDLVLDPSDDTHAETFAAQYPYPTPEAWDYIADIENWEKARITLTENRSPVWYFEFDAPAPTLTAPQSLDLCLKRYTHFYLKMAVPANPFLTTGYHHYASIFYELDNSGQWLPVIFPLWSDWQMHEYTFPIKLIDGRQQRLTGLRLQPMPSADPTPERNWFEIEDFRLLADPAKQNLEC
ncbi:MAG TPA: hypothetical protein VJZ27_17425, partial [Aggregatilineales bacterium]|nr:hypothetical protein [Aggregatilineales bacterium]